MSIIERPMYEERKWGTYRVLDIKEGWLVKELVVFPGKNLSYQKHSHRDEVWTISQGTGTLVIDGKRIRVERGSIADIKRGQLHSIKADEGVELRILEVQLGDPLIEEDIERFDFEW